MALRKARIQAGALGQGPIEIDGEPIHGVRSFKVDSTAGKVPRLTLDFLLGETEIDGEFQIEVSERTAWALGKLGWTPPKDA